jgi:lipoprotein-anchoring transpeptidase ErfK/SrfK
VEKIPEDLIEQSKLASLGYVSIEEALAERFHVSPGLLHRLNPSAKLTAGETLQVPDFGAPPEGVTAATLVVRTDGTLRVMDRDNKLVAQYPCSSGSEHDPLPIGTWKVTGIAKNPPFLYNPELFWDARPDHTKAKIAPGPNNPVGTVWIDITKDHYGIHGTPVPGAVGHTQSHGCIRLTNWDVQELAGLVKRGTPVICEK